MFIWGDLIPASLPEILGECVSALKSDTTAYADTMTAIGCLLMADPLTADDWVFVAAAQSTTFEPVREVLLAAIGDPAGPFYAATGFSYAVAGDAWQAAARRIPTELVAPVAHLAGACYTMAGDHEAAMEALGVATREHWLGDGEQARRLFDVLRLCGLDAARTVLRAEATAFTSLAPK